METTKAQARRDREGFFSLIRGRGVDIGAGNDPLPGAETWDKGQGDAVFVPGLERGGYDYVYSSHCLEHLCHPEIALKNWWGLLKPGGLLALAVPHRDLYEKKELLPSRFNGDHKFFILPDRDEAPCTFSLRGMVRRSCPDAKEEYVRVCDEGWLDLGPEVHSVGEYSIEGLWSKPR